MPLTVLFDHEAKKEVGECPVDAMMRVKDGRWKVTILWRLGGWENSMNIKHLPQLSAQALNEKQVELFNELLHPEAQ
jgi:DNA-binding HxlR family transcriptional regulator